MKAAVLSAGLLFAGAAVAHESIRLDGQILAVTGNAIRVRGSRSRVVLIPRAANVIVSAAGKTVGVKALRVGQTVEVFINADDPKDLEYADSIIIDLVGPKTGKAAAGR